MRARSSDRVVPRASLVAPPEATRDSAARHGTRDFAAGTVDTTARTITAEVRSFSERAVVPCPECALLTLSAEYNADRTIRLSWLSPVSTPAAERVRIERARVSGRFTVFESDFVPCVNLVPDTNIFTDTAIGPEAAFYYYRVRWASASGFFLGPTSNVEQITVFGTVGAPLANFTFAPAAPSIGDPITFDASASSDDGSIVFYDWDFIDDGTFDDQGRTVPFSYNTEGSHTVRLCVTDDTGVTMRAVNVERGEFTLTVVIAGDGPVFSRDGNETTGQPPTLFCLGDNDPATAPVPCQAAFACDTFVTLTPISFNPALPPGARHATWQGCFHVTTNGDCEVFMDGAKTVTATRQ